MSDANHSRKFAMLPIEAISDHRLGLIELRVLAALHSFRGRADDILVYPSRKKLAERSGYSPPSVSRAVSGLVRLGWVSVQQHRGPNTYRLFTSETVTDSTTVADPATVADSETVAESDINSDRSGHETVTDPATPEETKKRPRRETRSKPTVPTCPHSDIIDLYHEILPELQRVQLARWKGSSREKDLQARWREDERHRDMRFWRWFFESVHANPFYLGEGERGWRADLGWLLKRKNFDAIIERAADQRRRMA